MPRWDEFGLAQFLASYSKMRLLSYGEGCITLAGDYEFRAQRDGYHEIADTYALALTFTTDYPKAIPCVVETGHRVARDASFHTYQDGSFCLGSEIRIKAIIHKNPKFTEFAKKILDPFLYSVTYKIKYDEFPYGDLAHGEPGLIDDYERLFDVGGKKAVLGVLNALGKRKRVANKLPCPCGCGRRLGKCDFRFKLEERRKLSRRRWFRDHLKECFTPLEKVKKKERKKRHSRRRQ